jgi:hypothetical protein
MATKLESAMSRRRDAARAEAKRRYPECECVLVSFFSTTVIVDVKTTAQGPWMRFEHIVEVDEVAAEQAEIGSRRREVVHGAPA